MPWIVVKATPNITEIIGHEGCSELLHILARSIASVSNVEEDLIPGSWDRTNILKGCELEVRLDGKIEHTDMKKVYRAMYQALKEKLPSGTKFKVKPQDLIMSSDSDLMGTA